MTPENPGTPEKPGTDFTVNEITIDQMVAIAAQQVAESIRLYRQAKADFEYASGEFDRIESEHSKLCELYLQLLTRPEANKPFSSKEVSFGYLHVNADSATKPGREFESLSLIDETFVEPGW